MIQLFVDSLTASSPCGTNVTRLPPSGTQQFKQKKKKLCKEMIYFEILAIK